MKRPRGFDVPVRREGDAGFSVSGDAGDVGVGESSELAGVGSGVVDAGEVFVPRVLGADELAGVSQRSGWLGRAVARGRVQDPVRVAKRRLRVATRARRRAQRSSERRFLAYLRARRRGLFLSVGAVAGLFAVSAAVVFSPFMAVRSIEVSGAQAVSVDVLKRRLAGFVGRPLALVGEREVRAVLADFKQVESYKLELVPPHTVRLQLRERVALVSVAEGAGFALYDLAGVRIGFVAAPPPGVPVATDAAAVVASEAFRACARVVSVLPEEVRAAAASVTSSGEGDVSLVLSSGLRVVWGDGSDSRLKAVVLTRMLERLGVDAARVIDLSAPTAPVYS